MTRQGDANLMTRQVEINDGQRRRALVGPVAINAEDPIDRRNVGKPLQPGVEELVVRSRPVALALQVCLDEPDQSLPDRCDADPIAGGSIVHVDESRRVKLGRDLFDQRRIAFPLEGVIWLENRVRETSRHGGYRRSLPITRAEGHITSANLVLGSGFVIVTE
jgi:hypothetical protein